MRRRCAVGERIKGKTLVARDKGDDANGVLIKLYGEETNGAISIIEQPFEPGLPRRVGSSASSRTSATGCAKDRSGSTS
jgi:hypothetical protein